MRAAPAAATLLVAAVLVGCGGGDGGPRETRDSDRPAIFQGGGGPDPDAFERFQDCLRDNGVEMPEPKEGEPTIVQPPPEDVRRKCEKYLPEGGPGPAPQQAPLPREP